MNEREPHIILLDRPDPNAKLMVSKDFSALPPPPHPSGRPYMHFAIKEMAPVGTIHQQSNTEISDTQPEIDVSPEKSDPTFTLNPTGLLVVSNISLDDIVEQERRQARQFQRLQQFKSLVDVSDEHVRSHEGDVTPESTQNLMAVVKQILASWYLNELSQEPLTKAVADGMLAARLPQESDTIAAAEKHIREALPNISDVTAEIEQILHPKSQRKPQKIESRLVEEKQKAKSANEEQKAKAEWAEMGREFAESNAVYNQAKQSKAEFNPEDDLPSASAAEYVRQLLRRSF